MIHGVENIGHDTFNNKILFQVLGLQKIKQGYIGIEIIGIIKLDIKDGIGYYAAIAKPQGPARYPNSPVRTTVSVGIKDCKHVQILYYLEDIKKSTKKKKMKDFYGPKVIEHDGCL